jgi:hypothetical protein
MPSPSDERLSAAPVQRVARRVVPQLSEEVIKAMSDDQIVQFVRDYPLSLVDYRWASSRGLWNKSRCCWSDGGMKAYLLKRSATRARREVERAAGRERAEKKRKAAEERRVEGGLRRRVEGGALTLAAVAAEEDDEPCVLLQQGGVQLLGQGHDAAQEDGEGDLSHDWGLGDIDVCHWGPYGLN